MELIDKEKVVSEIDKLKGKISDSSSYCNGWQHALHMLELSLNTIEVKNVDLENSMVCKVDWYDGFLLDYTQKQQDELLEKIGAEVGDKIRVILIKE